jgi:hypothetical protein
MGSVLSFEQLDVGYVCNLSMLGLPGIGWDWLNIFRGDRFHANGFTVLVSISGITVPTFEIQNFVSLKNPM